MPGHSFGKQYADAAGAVLRCRAPDLAATISKVMNCPDCGEDLDQVPVGQPCPNCGSEKRNATTNPVTIALGVSIPTPRLIFGSNRPDGSRETTVRGRDFESLEVVAPSSEATQRYEGERTEGESDVLQVCRNLRGALRRNGVDVLGGFKKPDEDQGVDCEGTSADGDRIEVQVTGVIPSETMKALGTEGRASSQKDKYQLATEVCHAVRSKVESRKPADPSQIILALDAIRSPGHAKRRIVEVLEGESYNIIRSSGFAAVWLVGPTPASTFLLSEP